MLKALFDEKTAENQDVIQALDRFGKESGMWQNLTIREYGDTEDLTAPFEIRVQLGAKELRLTNVGYGVSQVLPVLVELLTASNDTLFFVQQPEVHLHPKAQAALGSMIHFLASKQKKSFLLETHSDYILDRFLIEQHRNKDADHQPTAQVLFFERQPDGSNKITPIGIDCEGRFENDPPETYRQFFIDEQLELLSF